MVQSLGQGLDDDIFAMVTADGSHVAEVKVVCISIQPYRLRYRE